MVDLSQYSSNRSLGEQCHDAMVEMGKAKAAAFRFERMYKRKRAQVYLMSSGTVAERDALARTHKDVTEVEAQWIEAETSHNMKRAEADGLRLRFEEWRTLQSTKRAEMQMI